MLQEHMRRILDQCKLQDDYAKDLDERGTFAFLCYTGICTYYVVHLRCLDTIFVDK